MANLDSWNHLGNSPASSFTVKCRSINCARCLPSRQLGLIGSENDLESKHSNPKNLIRRALRVVGFIPQKGEQNPLSAGLLDRFLAGLSRDKDGIDLRQDMRIIESQRPASIL